MGKRDLAARTAHDDCHGAAVNIAARSVEPSDLRLGLTAGVPKIARPMLVAAALALSISATACDGDDGDLPTLGESVQAVTPTDPLASQQLWHYGAIRVPGAWGLTTGSSSVLIAVVDSGTMPHPDLDSQWWGGYDFFSGDADATDRGTYHHGIHTAGTLAAVAGNGIGGTGICWGCKLMPLRVLQRGGNTSPGEPGRRDPPLTLMARAIRYAAGLSTDNGLGAVVQSTRKADVINISIGDIPATTTCEPAIQSAVNAAVAAGSTVVAAVGNVTNGDTNAAHFMWAHCANVIVVTAVASNGTVEPYALRGAGVTIAAPGGSPGGSGADQAGWGALIGCTDPLEDHGVGTHGVVSTWSTHDGTACYRHWAGTSMAAPHVAGTVALMRSRNPALTPAQIRSLLLATASNVCKTCPPEVDAYAAVNAAIFDASLSCEATGGGSFSCMAAPVGGAAPLAAQWTGQVNASIDPGATPEAATGHCSIGLSASVRYSVTDGAGRTVVKTRSFMCNNHPN